MNVVAKEIPIALQTEAVTEAVNGFLVNLVQALVIVIGLLMLFMGLRSGLLIGAAVSALAGLGIDVAMTTNAATLRNIATDLRRAGLNRLNISLDALNPETFRQCFGQSGMEIEFFGGYWLKPVANGQIEGSWTPEMSRLKLSVS